MIDQKTRILLSRVDTEFSSASFSLFKVIIWLEKIDQQCFEKTIKEMKEKIKDIGDAQELLVDFLNKHEFPDTKKGE